LASPSRPPGIEACPVKPGDISKIYLDYSESSLHFLKGNASKPIA
jgi:hypothetical protein